MSASKRRRAWPHIIRSAAWLLVGVGGLVGCAVLVAHGSITEAGSFVRWLTTVLVKPPVTISLVFLLLVLCAASVRGLLLEYLAWLPGNIEVPNFSEGSDLKSVTVGQLATSFRHYMTTLRLRSPTAVPGVSPGMTFIDVVGGGGGKSNDWVATLVALLKAAIPTHAFRVETTVFERSNERLRCGVFVQVIRLPSEAMKPAIIWETDWDGAMRHAAAAVTAAILPRTRLCRGPWATWRGYALPADLLYAYEEATDAQASLRYDEALSLYHHALAADPKNLVIRLRIGQLQEKLGLFLDALATYESLLALETPGGTRLPRGLYPRRAVRRERERAYLVSKFRRVVLLAGEQVTKQWMKTNDSGGAVRRDLEREALRNMLMQDNPKRRAAYGRKLTALRAELLREAEDALKELRPLVKKRRIQSKTMLSPAVLRVVEAIVEVRGELENPERRTPILATIQKKLGAIGKLTTWMEHYDAACAWAMPLALPAIELTPEDEEELVQAAIKHLELACAHADSGFIASRREWILSEDPDLVGLRTKDRFKNFETCYFAQGSLTPRRPRAVHKLAVTRYTRDLLVDLAKVRESAWHRRAVETSSTTDVHTLLNWWREEDSAWKTVDDVSQNYRDWRSRLNPGSAAHLT